MNYIVENYQSLENFRKVAIQSLKDKSKRDKKRKLSIKSIKKDIRCPDPDLLEYAFGSIDNAIRAAGLYPARPNEEDLKQSLQEFYKEYGRSPRQFEAAEGLTVYSAKAYGHHFGSWNNALKATGLPVIEPCGGYNRIYRRRTNVKTAIIST